MGKRLRQGHRCPSVGEQAVPAGQAPSVALVPWENAKIVRSTVILLVSSVMAVSGSSGPSPSHLPGEHVSPTHFFALASNSIGSRAHLHTRTLLVHLFLGNTGHLCLHKASLFIIRQSLPMPSISGHSFLEITVHCHSFGFSFIGCQGRCSSSGHSFMEFTVHQSF